VDKGQPHPVLHSLYTILNGPAHYTQSHHLSNGLALGVVLGALLAEIVAAWVLALLLFKIIQNTRPFISLALRHFGVGKHDAANVFLELIFPADTTKSAYATEQLHILLRHHSSSPNRWHKVAAYKQLHSLELCSTNDTGIRYIMVVPVAEEAYVTHSLRSYLPGLKINKVEDYLKSIKGSTVGVIELSLSSDFVLPLQDHKALEEHDLMAYLTGHMTKLATDGLIGYQIITTPVTPRTHHRVTRHIRSLQRRIAAGKEVSSQLVSPRTRGGFYWWLLWYPPLWFISTAMKVVTGFSDILFSMFSKEHDLPRFMQTNRDKLLSNNPYAGELSKSVRGKLDQPLYEVSIRVLIASDDTEVIASRLEAIVASFRPCASPNQSIVQSSNMSLLTQDKHLLTRYKTRSLSPHFPDQQTIVSSSELSDLYHFPNTDLTKTEGLIKSRSKELSAPLSMKHSDVELDVIVGANSFGGEDTPIGLTLQQRQKHTYVIGKTGTGKTTMLTSAIYQDMMSGKGVAVLDPHGDMFRELLEIVPEHRVKDVIVFDPSDRQHPIGLNILAPGVHFDNQEDEHEWITGMVLSVFAKLADESFWGPRMEHVLRSATLTALQLPNPSLYTLQRLLTDKKYQKHVSKLITDPVLKQFWNKELAIYGNKQLASMAAPLTNRLGHFITTKMSRHILLQAKSTISISDIMNEGKILLVNLSKGDIGEDQSFFFGTLLTSLVWVAAYQRTKIPESKRRDFYLYIDEFQNFATPQFTDITSEGRKFHISLTASHQNIAQIEDPSVLKTVAANVGSIICLKASPDDEAFILPFMEPAVEKGDIVNLAPYKFFMKTTTEDSEEAFSGTTQRLDVEHSSKAKDEVIASSREHFSTPRKAVEEYLEGLFGQK
jgi:hypothetical protein